MWKNSLCLILCLLILGAGCTAVRAPGKTVPKRKAITTDAFGGWLSLINNSQDTLQGELIAATGESLYVLTHSGPLEISKEDITSARLVVYNTNTSEYVLWAILGSLSTISNGFYFVFTFPAWLLAGIPTSIGESKRNNYLDYPANSLEEMIKYSRFPQGLPAGIELPSLRPRL